MWDIKIACEKILQYYIDKRNNAPRCIVCNEVLYSYRANVFSDLYLLEVKYRKIHAGMNKAILQYLFDHYPYDDNESLVRHHVNYAKNIQVPVCASCHGKIHGGNNPELVKWKPVDKRPKNFKGFNSNIYKPLTLE